MRNVSRFHLNICFHSNNFNDPQFVIQLTNMDFGFISISDSRINENKQSVVDINIPYHIFELCPTESSASGTLLYVRNPLLYKRRKDLNIYKSYEPEINFCWNFNDSKKTEIVIGCIYKNPGTNHCEFNKFYLNELLNKLWTPPLTRTFIITPNIF